MEFLLEPIILFCVGIGAAALNAIAGGGTFFTFPILIFMGLSPTLANTTNKVAIWAGATASIGGYWREVRAQQNTLVWFCVTATLGSVAGSLLLLQTPVETFRGMVPWLMLIATAVFAGGQRLLGLLQRSEPPEGEVNWLRVGVRRIVQFLIGLYGGFFGAGIGILLMAFCQLFGVTNIHETNAVKVVVATCLLTLSAMTFIITGAVAWAQAIPLVAGTLIGGFYGASFAKKLPEKLIRGFVVVYGFAVAGYFFVVG